MFDGAPFDQILVIDMETVWCKKSRYSLSVLTNEEYLRDPRFHAWGLCWKVFGSRHKAKWVRHGDIPDFVASIDWSRTAVLAHNAQFDVSVLSWVYGAKPAFIFDSLSMARALRGLEAGNSLGTLAEHYGLPPKGKALHSTDGIFREQGLSAVVEEELADYCSHDVYLCEVVFKRLHEDGGPFPLKELRLIDMTLKMYTNPVLGLDADLLEKAIVEEKEKREALLERLGIQEKLLASNPQFALILEGLGVEPPKKISKTTGNSTYAFAKNDALFQALLNHAREDISLLCEARLKVKSTMERTRAQRFLDISTRGTLPVPLSYYGAHTGRWTAAKGSSINMQNLKRGSFLRDAVLAPDDFVLCVGDLSQIEPRVLAWMADYYGLLEIFRSGADTYAVFGGEMFAVPGMTKDTHPLLRQAAKSAVIGCGYQLGWASFAAQLMAGFMGAPPVTYGKTFAKQAGVNGAYVDKFVGWEENLKKMALIPHTCSEEDLLIHCLSAKAIIDRYRSTAHPVVSLWEHFHGLIERSLYNGEEVVYKCLTFRKEEIGLPNGMRLRYPNLQKKIVKSGGKTSVEWSFDGRRSREKLYGGKITENVTQALARIVMTDGMLRVQKRYFIAGTVHDELIAVVPKAESDAAKPWVREQMVKVPSWMQGIPLASSVDVGVRYGDAK